MADKKRLSWGEALSETGRRFKDSHVGHGVSALADLLAPSTESPRAGPGVLPADDSLYDLDNPGARDKQTARNRGTAGAIGTSLWEGLDRYRSALTNEKPVEHNAEGMVADTEVQGQFNTAGNLMLGGRGIAGAVPQLAKDAEGAAGIFIGQRARNNATQQVERDVAERLLADGATPDQAWKETGWGKDHSGKWMRETDDSKAKLKPGAIDPSRTIDAVSGPRSMYLPDFLDHPELFEAYPAWKNMPVHITPDADIGGAHGAFSPMTRDKAQRVGAAGAPGHILLNEKLRSDPDELLSVLLHELNHGAQRMEGFPQGTNPSAVMKTIKDKVEGGAPVDQRALDGFNKLDPMQKGTITHNLYRRHAGEASSENVQRRKDYTAEERRAVAPWQTEDADLSGPVLLRASDRHAKPFSADAAPEAGELAAAMPDRTFTPGKGMDEYERVDVDVKKLDADLAKDRGMYVGPGGEGGIKTRYPDFGRWLAENPDTPVEMPRMGIDGFDRPSFGNGRHRFAHFRDNGATELPVMVNREQAQAFRDRYGASAAPSPAASAPQGHGVPAADLGSLDDLALAKKGPSAETGKLADALAAPAVSRGETLFDYDPKKLSEVPNVAQHDLPAPPSSPRGLPEHVQPVVSAKNLDRMDTYVDKGLEQGHGGFYNTQQLKQQFQGELGEAEGGQGFERFMDMVAATSPQNKTPQNARTASYYYMRDRQGDPLRTTSAPPETPYGHYVQKTHQRGSEDVVDRGGLDPTKNPKVARFGANLKGNWQPLTVDLHNLRALDYKAKNGKPLDAPEPGHYRAIEEAQQTRAAKKGLTPAQYQELAWFGAGDVTGLKSPPDPFLKVLEDRVNITAKKHGLKPQEVLRRMMKGEMPLLALPAAAGAASALAGGDPEPQ